MMEDKLLDCLCLWAEDRISNLAASNPRLSVASVYMKRGIRNYLMRERERIGKTMNDAALFLRNEDGKMDLESFFDDLMSVFKEMNEIPFSYGIVAGTFGKGVIRIQLPDNLFVNLLFGELGSIKITTDDFEELRGLLTDLQA